MATYNESRNNGRDIAAQQKAISSYNQRIASIESAIAQRRREGKPDAATYRQDELLRYKQYKADAESQLQNKQDALGTDAYNQAQRDAPKNYNTGRSFSASSTTRVNSMYSQGGGQGYTGIKGSANDPRVAQQQKYASARSQELSQRPGIYESSDGTVQRSSLSDGTFTASQGKLKGQTVTVRSPIATGANGKNIYAPTPKPTYGINLFDQNNRQAIQANQGQFKTTGDLFKTAETPNINKPANKPEGYEQRSSNAPEYNNISSRNINYIFRGQVLSDKEKERNSRSINATEQRVNRLEQSRKDYFESSNFQEYSDSTTKISSLLTGGATLERQQGKGFFNSTLSEQFKIKNTPIENRGRLTGGAQLFIKGAFDAAPTIAGDVFYSPAKVYAAADVIRYPNEVQVTGGIVKNSRTNVLSEVAITSDSQITKSQTYKNLLTPRTLINPSLAFTKEVTKPTGSSKVPGGFFGGAGARVEQSTLSFLPGGTPINQEGVAGGLTVLTGGLAKGYSEYNVARRTPTGTKFTADSAVATEPITVSKGAVSGTARVLGTAESKYAYGPFKMFKKTEVVPAEASINFVGTRVPGRGQNYAVDVRGVAATTVKNKPVFSEVNYKGTFGVKSGRVGLKNAQTGEFFISQSGKGQSVGVLGTERSAPASSAVFSPTKQGNLAVTQTSRGRGFADGGQVNRYDFVAPKRFVASDAPVLVKESGGLRPVGSQFAGGAEQFVKSTKQQGFSQRSADLTFNDLRRQGLYSPKVVEPRPMFADRVQSLSRSRKGSYGVGSQELIFEQPRVGVRQLPQSTVMNPKTPFFGGLGLGEVKTRQAPSFASAAVFGIRSRSGQDQTSKYDYGFSRQTPQRITASPITVQRPMTVQRVTPSQKPVVKQTPTYDYAPRFDTLPKQTTTPRISTITPYTPIPRITQPPELGGGGFGFPGFPIPPGQSGPERGRASRSFQYAPSLTARFFNIQGSAPKGQLTGFEIRPLSTMRRKA